MKINLLKVTPFFFILLLILILIIGNQNEKAQLKILIWNTPSIALGSFLAISTGSGFILSYLITSSLASLTNYQSKSQIIFNDNRNYEEKDKNNNIPIIKKYENTLIERNIKDPSPTITANFRILRRNESTINNYKSNNIKYNDSFLEVDEYQDKPVKETFINNKNLITTDWNDNSFLNW